MMKKKKLALSLLIIGLVYVMLCGYTRIFDENAVKVYDLAELFKESEAEELQTRCVSAAKTTKLDVGVLTVNDTMGLSTRDFSDAFYDKYGYGFDQGYSGVLFVIDMDNREFYINTCGIAIQYFNDDDIEDISCELDDLMGSHDYYGASKKFIEEVENHVHYINENYSEQVNPWFAENYTDYADYINAHDFDNSRKKSPLKNIFVDLGIGLLTSAIIVLIIASGNKSKMTANANTYLNNNKFTVHHKSDIFLRTTVTKHKIESSSGGGRSGGSYHSSSSGRSHGGGGHKF